MNNKKNSKPTKFENDPGKNTVAPMASKLNPKGMKKATAKGGKKSSH